MREIGSPEHASTEQLSALLDDRAEPGDRWFLTDHVDGCHRCSSELEGLRSVQMLLRAIPLHLPPRNFTIPVPLAASRPRYQRLIPFTRALSALAAVLCVVFFSADALLLGGTSAKQYQETSGAMQITTTMVGGQPSARSAAENAAEARTGTTAGRAEYPPVAEAAKPAEARPADAARPAEAAKPAEAARSAPAASAARPAAAAPPPAPAAAPAAAAQPAQPGSAAKPAAAPAVQPAPALAPTLGPLGTTAPFQATQQPAQATMPPRTTSVAVIAPPQAPAGTGAELAPIAPGTTADLPTRVAGFEVTPLRAGGLILALIALVLLGWSLALGRAART
ncbi:MAG: hypothetical protein IT306_08040 [Chloroflexi bacterium]|nr:hypothetical protein [Chloroflexota bacterium]